MKKEDLYDAVTNLPDKYVKEAKKRKIPRWTAAVAAILTVVILLSIFLGTGGVNLGRGGVQVLAAAEYPQMAAYPNEQKYIKWNGEFDDEAFRQVYDRWQDDLNDLRPEEDFADGLETYFPTAARALLSGSQGNRVCSPLNVYMALAMLAEITDGDTRQEILAALGSDGLEDLRTQAKAVWRSVYRQDGAVNSVLANSLWLDQGESFRQETVDRLAENDYASVYRGEMGSEELDKALRDWLDEQTGGLLKKATKTAQFSPDTVLALASTVYFQSKWTEEFSKSNTREGTFHGLSGDTSADFLRSDGADTYYWGEGFAAYGKRLESGGTMWFFLPDEGVTPEDLLAGEDVFTLASDSSQWENQARLIVHVSIPKFDVFRQQTLTDALETMGISKVFNPAQADFSPISENALCLSQTDHAARLAIDEEGVTAVAYTLMEAAGAARPPEEEVDFRLDRPFLTMVTSQDGLLLFAGIVCDIE